MRGTRSSKPAAADAPKDKPASKSKYVLSPKSGQASKLFILPRKASSEARIISLPHPQSGRPSRYLVCPETGIYEFTKVTAPKATPRSWLIASANSEEGQQGSVESAETTTCADLFVATHVDPLFLLLPALIDATASKSATDQKCLFLSSEDYFDKLPGESSHLSEIVRWPKTRALLESRMAAICDTVDAGDESMFRINEEKLFSIIFSKASCLGNGGLPASIEEKFVQKVLEAPIMLRTTNSLNGPATAVTAAEDTEPGVSTPKTESAESQSSTTTEGSTLSIVSQPSTAASSFSEEAAIDDAIASAMTASPEVTQLQRIRVAFDFICASYIPQALAGRLKQSLACTSTCKTDFAPLDTYMAELEKLRKDIMATRSLDNFSRKRMRDEEEDEARLEKKRKMEEEKKRKATESRGVRDLKKVNTTGMKKLSAFFTKK